MASRERREYGIRSVVRMCDGSDLGQRLGSDLFNSADLPHDVVGVCSGVRPQVVLLVSGILQSLLHIGAEQTELVAGARFGF